MSKKSQERLRDPASVHTTSIRTLSSQDDQPFMSMSLVLEAILPAIIYSRVLHRDTSNITHGIVSGDVDKSRLPTREDGGE